MKIVVYLVGTALLTCAVVTTPTLAQTVPPSHVSHPLQVSPVPLLVELQSKLSGLFLTSQIPVSPAFKIVYEHDNVPAAYLTVRYQTRKFWVYSRYMTGAIALQPEQEEGPDYQGFLMEISEHPGSYEGQLVSGQTLSEPYWKTYVAAYPTKGENRYLWISLSYGARTDSQLIEKIKQATASAASASGNKQYLAAP